MSLLDTIFGSGSQATGDAATSEGRQYAVLLNAGPERPAVAGNGFNYALEFDDAGYETRVFLDGKATKWPDAFVDDPDRPFSQEWEEIRTRGLLAGACGYCANAFDVAEACETYEIALLSDSSEHAPAVATLADDGYEILTVG